MRGTRERNAPAFWQGLAAFPLMQIKGIRGGGAEFRYVRSAGLKQSQAGLAKLLGNNEQAVARWEKSGELPRWADIAPSGGSQTWVSMGIRPVYAITQHVKIQGDLGNDRVTPDNGPTRTLLKASVALTLAMDRSFWSRPELRLFYTYAHWNQAAQNAAAPGDPLSTTGIFGSSRAGSTVGAQVEWWW
jgi:maltoporin